MVCLELYDRGCAVHLYQCSVDVFWVVRCLASAALLTGGLRMLLDWGMCRMSDGQHEEIGGK